MLNAEQDVLEDIRGLADDSQALHERDPAVKTIQHKRNLDADTAVAVWRVDER